MLKTTKNEELRYLTLLLYFPTMIVNNKVADQTGRKTSALLFFVISRIEAHVMLKPRHPGFCLAARLYLETNTIFLCFDALNRRFIREALQEGRGEGKCPHVPLK